MALTLEEVKNLKYGDTLYSTTNKNKDGSPQRWRVNGIVKTWKTRPEEVRVPIKHGLRLHGYVTHENMHMLTLNEEEIQNG